MSILKKLGYFLSIVCFGVSMHAQQNDFDSQNLLDGLNLIGRVLNQELEDGVEYCLTGNCGCDRSSDCICFLGKVELFIQERLPDIKNKCAQAIARDLNDQQRAVLITTLRDCKSFAEFTRDDLKAIVEIGRDKDQQKAIKEAISKRFMSPEDMEILSGNEKMVALRQLENVDLGDPSFNLLSRFICRLGYLDELGNLVMFSTDRDSAGLCGCVAQFLIVASFPFAMFDEDYDISRVQEGLEISARVFALAHTISSELLDALEQ